MSASLTSRDRVMAAVERHHPDRLPLRHLAVEEVNRRLREVLGVSSHEQVLDHLGHDFRELQPQYVGSVPVAPASDHGVLSGNIFYEAVAQNRPRPYPLAQLNSAAEVAALPLPDSSWHSYSSLAAEAEVVSDHARILGYCEGDFLNGCASLRGEEQLFLDLATRAPVLLELIEQRFDYTYGHLEAALIAAGGAIDFIHFGEDLGHQQGLLLSLTHFEELLGQPWAELLALAHRHGARTMLHACGAVAEAIPLLLDLGLDVLDVVQTNAAGMELEILQERFGGRLTFAGSLCVQKLLPFGTPAGIRAEVIRRREKFAAGGLILGPSHQIQADTPLENILSLYAAALE